MMLCGIGVHGDLIELTNLVRLIYRSGAQLEKSISVVVKCLVHSGGPRCIIEVLSCKLTNEHAALRFFDGLHVLGSDSFDVSGTSQRVGTALVGVGVG